MASWVDIMNKVLWSLKMGGEMVRVVEQTSRTKWSSRVSQMSWPYSLLKSNIRSVRRWTIFWQREIVVSMLSSSRWAPTTTLQIPSVDQDMRGFYVILITKSRTQVPLSEPEVAPWYICGPSLQFNGQRYEHSQVSLTYIHRGQRAILEL